MVLKVFEPMKFDCIKINALLDLMDFYSLNVNGYTISRHLCYFCLSFKKAPDLKEKYLVILMQSSL